METALSRSMWYAEGLRWIGALLNQVADRLERGADSTEPLDPRVRRELEEYVSNVRHRVHIHF